MKLMGQVDFNEKPRCLTLTNSSDAFTIKDDLTGIEFLIDTGSSYSIIPVHLATSYSSASITHLRAVNYTKVGVVGETASGR